MGYDRDKTEIYDCDRCNFRYKKSQLKLQKGLLICPDCYDDVKENKSIDMKLGSNPRTDSDTTTAVESPTVFSITAAGGITASHSTDSVSSRSVTLEIGVSINFGSSYYMKIVGSGGAINITADPQIVVGQAGDILTLQGTNDTNTVLLEDGTGVELVGGVSFTIGNNDVITLVYDNTKTKWVEVSRTENGGF